MIKTIKIWKRIAEKWQGGLPRREGAKNAILSVIHAGKKHKKPTPANAPYSPAGKAPYASAGKTFSKRQALLGTTNAEKPTESDDTHDSLKNLSEDRQPESPGTGNPLSKASLPGDIRAVLTLGESLAALDRSDMYVARSDYLRLIANTRKDLQDLQVLRGKNLLDYYCGQNGMPSSAPVEKILLLCSEAPITVPLDHSASDPTAASSRDTAAPAASGTIAPASSGTADPAASGTIAPTTPGTTIPAFSDGSELQNPDISPEGAPAAPRLQALFDAHNARFLSHALEKEKDYLDHILDAVDPGIRLDEAQRRMVLTDEDNCLVIAGAGAGKTTSVAAKVKYLVDRKNIRPEEILVISFTNKAVDELRTRIQKDLKIPCPIATFHSAGNAVLHMHDPERINIVDADKKFYVIRDYFRGNILRDERLVHSLILFFASYFDAPLNEKDLEAFFRGIAQMRYTSMKSELGEYCTEIMDAQLKKKVTIRNELMRSAQEVEIANFLYRNGIDYVYEPVYRYHIEMAKKPYTPDFLIRQGDREIYLEHFGITQDGRNNRYDLQRLQAYKDAVNNKVLLHRQHGTELIYTFSGYRDGRSLTEHLEGELRAHGVEFYPRSEEEILRKILQNAENHYVRKLIMLICRFITNFKTDGYTEMQFAIMKESTNNVRTKLFLDICQACYLEYQRVLRELQAVDFEDMINDSARALRECAQLRQRLPFKYIIVDEYQDISRQRFDLTKALREICDAKVIAVGDDWQSIYAFSGSDITLFTQFEKKMGPAAMLRIENTYRNAQELIDIAGSFVQKNPAQITKTLHSEKRIEDPVIIYSYDASRKGFGKNPRFSQNVGSGQNSISGYNTGSGTAYNMGRAIEAALDHIVEKHGILPQNKELTSGNQSADSHSRIQSQTMPQQHQTQRQQTQPQQAQQQQPQPPQITPNQVQPRVQIPPIHILLLGRYNFDGYKLEQTDLFTYRGKGAGRQIISKKYPFLKITFMTAHASKGLGYDEVIVINGQGGTYGFPSQIEDDPVLSLVLREDRSYAYAEERRLFYVAMTRTKNRVYFIAPQQEPSEFLQELLRDYKNVRLDPFGDAEHKTEKDLYSISGKNEQQERSDTASGQTESAIAELKESVIAAESMEKIKFLQQSDAGLSAGKKICPICGYPLQLRYKVSYGLRLYLCTNDSEICGFMTNNLRGGRLSIIKCDRCADGYLIVHIRKNGGEPFLGCTNYTRDKRGCGRTMGWPEYRQKMRYEAGYRSEIKKVNM